MILVTVMYGNKVGGSFDMEYYLNKHVPLVQDRLSPISASVLQGIASGSPGEPAPYTTICNLTFQSTTAFEEVFGPSAPEVLGDIPNFTNIEPTIQISEVMV